MIGFFDGVSYRLAKIGILLAVFAGLASGVVQLYFDFERHRSNAEFNVRQVIEVALPGARDAIQNRDTAVAQRVIEGLLMHDLLLEVVLYDRSGPFASGMNEAELSAIKNKRGPPTDHLYSYIVSVNALDNSELGRFEVSVNKRKMDKPFYQHAVLLLSIGVIRSSILVLGLIVAFYFLLTKPLIRINQEVQAIDPGAPSAQRVSLPNRHHDDEFTQLSDSVNRLLDVVDLALSKRRTVEAVLRKSEEHVRQIIDSLPVWVGARNKDGHYIFANKALAEFLGTTPEALRGLHISDFERYALAGIEPAMQVDALVIDGESDLESFEEVWVDTAGNQRDMQTYVMPLSFYDETVSLVVSSDVTELKSTQERMEFMAFHDPLTRLPNRSYLIDYLDTEINDALASNYHNALLFIDLDQFKNINDSLGHPAGDAVLVSVARCLSDTVSDCDLVVRLGGDEFVVVLAHLGSDLEVAQLRAKTHAELLRSELSHCQHHYQDTELYVTGSIGIVMFPDVDSNSHDLLRFADTAMYKVKEAGRDAIEFYRHGMADSATHMLQMEDALRKAFENGDFELYFQPRMDIERAKIVGAEALLRLNHPERGMIEPAEFIPILEASGIIVDVGLWTLKHAFLKVKDWMQRGLWSEDMHIGVNISPRQFRSASFVFDIKQLIEEVGVPASVLEMEITEGIVIDNLEVTIDRMNALRDIGITFALDDFGTGYSSISYLKQLPVSVLKVDKSFVLDITDDFNDRILVQTITAMGNMLGLEVVAEGVETEDQLRLLQTYHCRYYQGHLCSRPVPAEAFGSLLSVRV